MEAVAGLIAKPDTAQLSLLDGPVRAKPIDTAPAGVTAAVVYPQLAWKLPESVMSCVCVWPELAAVEVVNDPVIPFTTMNVLSVDEVIVTCSGPEELEAVAPLPASVELDCTTPVKLVAQPILAVGVQPVRVTATV